MFKSLFDSPSSLFFAILIHALIVAVAVVGYDWKADEEKPKYKVVQARVVDESKIAKKIANLKKSEQKKLRQEKRQEEKLRKEEKRQADSLKKKQLLEKRKIEQDKKRIREEHKRKKFKNKQIKKKKIEDRRKVVEQKRQAKIKKEKQRLEKIKQKKRDKKKQEEQRRIDEQDLLRQQMEEEEAALKQEFDLEQTELDNARDSVDMSRVDAVVAMIQQRVEKNWRRSTSLKKKLTCIVYVKFMPTGDVLHVEITKSSGDAVFDKSVENAVRKAAPFPFPLDISDIFDKIREVEFEFDPEL